jgi:hypothetical protein
MLRHIRNKHGGVLLKPKIKSKSARDIPDYETLRLEWAIALGLDMRPFSLGDGGGLRHFLGLLG